MKKTTIIGAFLVTAALLLSACAKTAAPLNTAEPVPTGMPEGAVRPNGFGGDRMENIDLPDPLVMGPDRSTLELEIKTKDQKDAYDEQDAVRITFNDQAATVEGSGAESQGTEVTITQEGSYILAGSCRDGKILVDADKDEDIQLIFAGLDLACASDAVITVNQADTVMLTLEQGTQNRLSDGESYTDPTDEAADAAIFSRADTVINGQGSLEVKGNFAHGIESKDDLRIVSGDLTVTAPKTAIKGKDCVQIHGGTLNLSAGTNGIVSDNTQDPDRGYIWMSGGDVTLASQGDGLQAENFVCVDAGTLMITTGGGHEQTVGEEASAKGIKAGCVLYICGGEMDLSCAEDGLHSDDDLIVTGGSLTVRAGDDALHAESQLEIHDGNVKALICEEGIEGSQILMTGGDVSVTSRDDGVNAAGPAIETAQTNTQNDPRSPFADAEPDKIMEFRGGKIFVDAGGDGLDSNGYLMVSGGELMISGSSDSGNAAIDYGVTGVITGGTVLAAGAEGMAQGFAQTSAQGTWQTSVEPQEAGTLLALTGAEGTVLAAFSVPKAFSHVVASVAGMQEGASFELLNVEDVEGVKAGDKVSGISLAKVTMQALHEGSAGFGGMGGHKPGNMTGERPQMPDGGFGGGQMPQGGFENGQRPERPQGMDGMGMPDAPENTPPA